MKDHIEDLSVSVHCIKLRDQLRPYQTEHDMKSHILCRYMFRTRRYIVTYWTPNHLMPSTLPSRMPLVWKGEPNSCKCFDGLEVDYSMLTRENERSRSWWNAFSLFTTTVPKNPNNLSSIPYLKSQAQVNIYNTVLEVNIKMILHSYNSCFVHRL